MRLWAEENVDRISGWLRRVISASDIVADTLLAVLPRSAEFETWTEAELARYLRRAIESKVCGASTHFRRQKRDRWREVSLDSAGGSLADALESRGASPAEILAAQELRDRLDLALANLPPDQATAILWRYEAGLSHREIAVRMDRTLDAVSGLLQRAKETLARELEDDVR